MADIKVEAIMTSQVHCVTLAMTVRDGIKLLIKHGIAGAPIVNQTGSVVSVISEGDLLRLAATVGLDKPVGSCMERLCKTEKLISAQMTDSFKDVYKTFLSHSVHRVIVMDANGKLKGIVSRSNILRLMVESGMPDGKETQK